MKKLVSLLALCLATSSFAATPQPAKLKVILDWFPNPDHAPLIIAAEKGYFKKQGLEVELIGPADPNDPPKLVAAGKADIGITYEPQFMEQVDQGLPLVRIGTLIDKPLNCLVVLNDSGIKTLADLKGKRIGSTNGGLTSVLINNLLKDQGINQHDVTLVNVRYNLTQALLSKKVDAVTGMNRNIEVPQLEAQNKHVLTFFPEEHGIPNYSELIFISNQSTVKDPRLPKFLAAIKEAVAYLDDHPQEGWQVFAKRYPESNNKVNQQAWFATLPYFAEEPTQFDQQEWKSFAQFMVQNKLIKKARPVSDYAVNIG